jgi:hypothetical protein
MERHNAVPAAERQNSCPAEVKNPETGLIGREQAASDAADQKRTGWALR